MMRLVLCVVLICVVAACDRPVEVTYASYEDCILGKLGRGQSTVASNAIIAACRAKFPQKPWTGHLRDPISSFGPAKKPGLFDDVLDDATAKRPTDDTAWLDNPALYEQKAAPTTGPTRDVPDEQSAPDWERMTGRTPISFHGDRCTDDCSGHEAGYAWAEENEISDPADCDGNSDSFIEGCVAWAEENGE